MPEYRTPGVHVEEVERGPKPIEGVATSTAGFLGETERGPTDPRLVTSFADFRRTYGGVLGGSNLAYAVDGFFRNGGSSCYVGRIVPQDWLDNPADSVADATLQAGSDDVLTASAVGPGEWGRNVAVRVGDASMGGDRFKLTVGYWRDDLSTLGADPDYEADIEDAFGEADLEEVYDDLSVEEASSAYYETRVNGASNLVTLASEDGGDGPPDDGTTLLAASVPSASVGGSDFTGDTDDPPEERTGLAAFRSIDGIALVCVPDENTHGVTGDVESHCREMGDRFAILQAEQGDTRVSSLSRPVDSEYAAFYTPWLEVADPETNRDVLVPPGGHVAGVYARTDQQRGVHKAPANEGLRGVRGLEVQFTEGDQGQLNPQGINCIRSFRGRGIRIWGARTTSPDPLWKYVSVRRLFLYLEESIDEGTQWVVFEPNDENTWARVRQSISSFLEGVREDGALMGSTPEEAFYVKCDRSTMTQDDIDNGRLICEIGVAPVKPAEFVIFRISQWTGGVEGEG